MVWGESSVKEQRYECNILKNNNMNFANEKFFETFSLLRIINF